MSVIFDALNKLDKEKRAPKTGMLIVGAGSIADRRTLSAPLLGVLAMTLLLLGAGAWWWTTAAPRESPGAIAEQSASPEYAAEAPSTRRQVSPPAQPGDLAVVPVTTLAAAADAVRVAAPPVSEATPPIAAAETAPLEVAALRLEAITSGDDGPMAIVSGRLVREGDVFDGIRVVRIGESEVELFIQAEARAMVLRF